MWIRGSLYMGIERYMKNKTYEHELTQSVMASDTERCVCECKCIFRNIVLLHILFYSIENFLTLL